jgi:hypothetical protein
MSPKRLVRRRVPFRNGNDCVKGVPANGPDGASNLIALPRDSSRFAHVAMDKAHRLRTKDDRERTSGQSGFRKVDPKGDEGGFCPLGA